MRFRVLSNITNTIYRRRIFNKLIFFSIMIGIIPLIMMNMILNKRTEKIITEELTKSYAQVVQQYVSGIDYKLEKYSNLLDRLASDTTIQSVLTDESLPYEQRYLNVKEISREMGTLLEIQSQKELYNIMIYSFDTENPIYARRIATIDTIVHEPWMENIDFFTMKSCYFFYESGIENTPILSLVKPIVDTNLYSKTFGEEVGMVKLDLDVETFFSIPEDLLSAEYASYFILDQKQDVVYAANADKVLPMPADITPVNDEGVSLVTVDNAQYMTFHEGINLPQVTTVFAFNASELHDKVWQYRVVALMVTVLIIAVLSCGIVSFSRQISKRIGLLNDKIKKVESGDFSTTVSVSGDDEISLLDKSLDRMTLHLKELIDSNYVQKLKKADSELKALQLQINPHFLYNTLETISSMAAIHQCFDICTMNQKLGEIFRYSLNQTGNDLITLDKEISYLQNYIYIQKVRFGSSLEIIIDVDEDVCSCSVPRFILQPILENCMMHGFKMSKKNCLIEIKAKKQNNALNITICDNGCGISAVQLERINSYINEKDTDILNGYKQSIGMKNVNLRISLICGYAYGIEIHSVENEGTTVDFRLPLYDEHEVSMDV